MEIHRMNHTRPADNYTHRIQVYPEHTEAFKVLQAGAETGIKLEAQCMNYTWTIILSPEETQTLIQSYNSDMVPQDRDEAGRLAVPFYVSLIKNYMKTRNYVPDAFKDYVQSLNILTPKDWDREDNGYHKWKHRIDRAWQQVNTGI